MRITQARILLAALLLGAASLFQSPPAAAAISFVCAVATPSDNGTYDQAALPIALDLSGCDAQAGDLVIVGRPDVVTALHELVTR